jgi:serine/threonine protein kinase
MAPEQATGESSGPLSDIVSMGVMLFEMLGGKRPFERTSQPESVLETAVAFGYGPKRSRTSRCLPEPSTGPAFWRSATLSRSSG